MTSLTACCAMAGAAKARLTAVVAKNIRARWFIIFFPPQSMRPRLFMRSRLFWIWIQQRSDPLKSPHQGRSLLSAVTAPIGSDENVRGPARLQRAISPNLVSSPARSSPKLKRFVDLVVRKVKFSGRLIHEFQISKWLTAA
jgi:hypothetical protein